MSHTKYYLAFASSEQLAAETRRLLELRGNVPPQVMLKQIEKMIDLFVPEVLHNMLVGCCDAIGLSPMATKVVNGSVDTINSATRLLIGQLMKKRSDDEIIALAAFVDTIFLPGDRNSLGKDGAGAEISKSKYEEMQYVTAEVLAGRSQHVLPQLHVLMIEIADLIQDAFMKHPLDVLKLNFVVRKIVDGTFATCKGAAHMVVNRVFKNLDEEELKRMAVYFSALLVTAEHE